MKLKKTALFIATFFIMLFFYSTNVYANVAPLKPIFYAQIMRLIVFLILFIYIISCIIYLVKSKKSKVEKIKQLIIWLVIVIVTCLILWYGADWIIKNAKKRR